MKTIGTRSLMIAMVLMIAWSAWPINAQEGTPPQLTIEQAVMARRIENREPIGEGTVFPADVGQVACYTKVLGSEGENFIEHVWSQGDVERARVRLAVRSSAWRTWSTKRINPKWTGAWTVTIEDAEGRILDTLNFTIEAGATEGSGE